jgi:hypothetical protein
MQRWSVKSVSLWAGKILKLIAWISHCRNRNAQTRKIAPAANTAAKASAIDSPVPARRCGPRAFSLM